MILLKSAKIGTRLNIIMTGLYLFLLLIAMLLSYHRQQKLIMKVVINNARIIAGEASEAMGRVQQDHRLEDFQELVKRISMREKYSIRILSSDNRREEFRADSSDIEQMAWFAGSDLRESHRVVIKQNARVLVYMRPLVASPECLRCHGARAEAPQWVQRLYPEGDVFYGHRPGMLMGAIAVSVPMNEIDDEIWQNLRLDVVYRVFLFLIIIVAVNMVIRRTILNPLGKFSSDLVHIAESGNLSARATVPPDPDVARVAMAFNSVMDELSLRTEQYRDSEVRYRGIVEMAETPIVTFLEDGTVIVANPAAADLFGVPRDHFPGKDFYSLFDDGEALHNAVDDYLLDGTEEVFRQRVKVRTPDAVIELDIAFAASDREGKLVTAVLTKAPRGCKVSSS